MSRGMSDGAMPTARARAWALSSLQGDRIGCEPGHERRRNADGAGKGVGPVFTAGGSDWM